MSENLADLGQVRTRAQHLGRGGVTKAVAPDRRQSGPDASGTYDVGDAAGGQSAMWGANTRKDIRIAALHRSTVLKPTYDGATDIDR